MKLLSAEQFNCSLISVPMALTRITSNIAAVLWKTGEAEGLEKTEEGTRVAETLF